MEAEINREIKFRINGCAIYAENSALHCKVCSLSELAYCVTMALAMADIWPIKFDLDLMDMLIKKCDQFDSHIYDARYHDWRVDVDHFFPIETLEFKYK